VSSTTPGRSANVRRAVIGVAAVALVGGLAFQVHEARKPSRGGDPHTTIPQLSAVTTYDYVGAQHTDDAVTYAQTPPAGGPHDPQWEDCGVYTQPIRNENAVHSLEHGTVWITYRPGLSAAGVSTLESVYGSIPDKKGILSPYPDLPAPVVVSVWNAQLDLRGPNDPRLPVFVRFYGDGHTAPEAAFASCAGGVHNLLDPNHP
jgi:hypothetical protein